MTAHRWLTKRHSSLLSRACSTEGSCGSPSSRDRRRHHVLGRARRRGAARRRIVRRLDRRRAHPRLLRASHSVFTSRAADKVSSRPPPSQSPPQRCTARSFSPRRRSERPTLPRAAIKQARCLPSPHFPSTPTLPLPGTRRCDSRARSPHPSPADQARPDENPPGRSWPSHRRPPCRLMTAQKVAHPPVACRPSPSLCRRFCTNLWLSSVSPPPPPVCGPFNAGGKRRAEPSTTSRRAHGRSNGRTGPSLAAPLPALAGDEITNLGLSSVSPPSLL